MREDSIQRKQGEKAAATGQGKRLKVLIYILTERVEKEECVQFGRGNRCGRNLSWEIKRICI